MTWKLYRHDDAGAPVLDTSKGSMINLLEKCLVTGYGTTDQPSDPPDTPWNVDKSADGLHAVFWSDAADGSGHFFYIRDDGENDGDAGDDQVKSHGRECYLQGALSYSGFTNGQPDLSDIWPDTGDHPRGLTWVKNSSQPTTSAWWVCADRKTVYLYWAADQQYDFTSNPDRWARFTRSVGFGDLIDVIDGAFVSFLDGSQQLNDDRIRNQSFIHGSPDGLVVSTDETGTPGGTVAAPFGGIIHLNDAGFVDPSNLSDLSGPLFSRTRTLVLNTGNVASLFRLRGVRELSLRLRESTSAINTFFQDLMGVPSGDPQFATFDFNGVSMLALPAGHSESEANVLFIAEEDDQ